MDAERELRKWLAPWAAASAVVEHALGESCLTGEEIAAYADDRLEPDARERAKMHLSRCSFCTREVGSLICAAREFEDRRRLRRALGSMTTRVEACLRVFVDEARGAFTRVDALLQSLSPTVRIDTMGVPAGLAFAAARGRDDDPVDAGDLDPDVLRELALRAPGRPGVELLCGDEEDGGSITVSLAEPREIYLVAPDGTWQPVGVERGDDRYYAMITGMPPGGYMLALLRPGDAAPNPP
jgi:hypothetical protein